MRVTQRPLRGVGRIGLAVLLVLPAGVMADESEEGLQGSIELLYRNVSREGSSEKYDEDLDGLESGARLAGLEINWRWVESDLLDYARLDLRGLGGDPYETSSLRIGRKDAYDLKVKHTKRDYLYNLFSLVSNEDGAFWDAERTMTDIDLRIYPTERVQLFFQFQEGRRVGDSLFMKDINFDLFRLETPLDQTTKRYTVGANFEVGPADIIFRHTLSRYDNQFNNFAEGDVGLEGDTTLNNYSWIQNDSGSADLTTLRVSSPIGNRVNVAVSLFGTFLGKDEIESRAAQDFDGTGEPFPGAGFTVPIQVQGGLGNSNLDGDHTLVDADISVDIAEPLSVHLQYRSLDRDLDGTMTRDLDGDGTEDDLDGDGTPGTRTRLDYQLDTITLLADYRPHRLLGLRAGYRMIDRELTREGFGTLRDTDFRSDDDETLILGVSWRPVGWFRFNADFEDGDISQPFNAVAPADREHTRVRAVFQPRETIRIDVGYLDFQHTNAAPDIRAPGSSFDGNREGTTHSLSFWHRPTQQVDYTLRYAEQEIETRVGVTFDLAGFAAVENGDSVFDNDNTQFSAHANCRWGENWRLHFRYTMTESEGNNLLLGDVSGLVNDEVVAQDYEDVEIGAVYAFPSGLYLGASIRDFDYDDGGVRIDSGGTVVFRNDALNYNGQIFTLRAGLTF